MAAVLPLNDDLSLQAYDASQIAAFQLKRRGVGREHDHVFAFFSPDGNSCTRRFSCVWDQRFNAAVHFVGATKTYTDGGGDQKLSRLMPQRDPDNPNWIASKVEIGPWRFVQNLVDVDDPDDPVEMEAANPGYQKGIHVPVFDRAELKVTFEQSPMDLGSDLEVDNETQRYVTWPGDVGAEITTEADYIGLPGSILQYTTTDGTSRPKGIPIPFPVGFTEAKGRTRFIWRRVPYDAWGPSTTLGQRVLGTAADRGMVGSVNKTTFKGYPPLTLQLVNVEQRLLPDPTGLGRSWDIHYVIAIKPQPYGHLGFFFHDPLPSGAASGYYQAQRPAAGVMTKSPGSLSGDDAIFQVREFADLFTVGEV